MQAWPPVPLGEVALSPIQVDLLLRFNLAQLCLQVRAGAHLWRLLGSESAHRGAAEAVGAELQPWARGRDLRDSRFMTVVHS